MMKITIVLLLVSFNVLNWLKMLKMKNTPVRDFVNKLKSNGDYQLFEEIKHNLGIPEAITYCRQQYPYEDCETVISAYLSIIPNISKNK